MKTRNMLLTAIAALTLSLTASAALLPNIPPVPAPGPGVVSIPFNVDMMIPVAPFGLQVTNSGGLDIWTQWANPNPQIPAPEFWVFDYNFGAIGHGSPTFNNPGYLHLNAPIGSYFMLLSQAPFSLSEAVNWQNNLSQHFLEGTLTLRSSVDEPGTVALLGLSLIGVGYMVRRRNAKG